MVREQACSSGACPASLVSWSAAPHSIGALSWHDWGFDNRMEPYAIRITENDGCPDFAPENDGCPDFLPARKWWLSWFSPDFPL